MQVKIATKLFHKTILFALCGIIVAPVHSVVWFIVLLHVLPLKINWKVSEAVRWLWHDDRFLLQRQTICSLLIAISCLFHFPHILSNCHWNNSEDVRWTVAVWRSLWYWCLWWQLVSGYGVGFGGVVIFIYIPLICCCVKWKLLFFAFCKWRIILKRAEFRAPFNGGLQVWYSKCIWKNQQQQLHDVTSFSYSFSFKIS